MKHLVIIGNSAAGLSAAFKAREIDSNIKITIITDEKQPAYRRDKICSVLDESARFADIVFANEQDYKDKNIELIAGRKVEKVNTNKNWLNLSDKTKIVFDALIIASGASMSMPKCVKGSQKHGVLGMRSIADVRSIVELIPISNAVCIWGAGVASLQAAFALKKKKMEVKIIIQGRSILPGLCDENGEEFLKNLLKENEIELIPEQEIVEVFGEGDVKAIKLEKGKVLACDILVVNNHLKPNTKFLNDSGFEPADLEKGISVDVFMNTSFDNIFAAGDVLEPSSVKGSCSYDNPGAWQKAEIQGQIAAQNALAYLNEKSEEKTVYQPAGGLKNISMQVFGLPAVCLGVTAKFEDDDSLEELSFVDEQFVTYKKVVICDSKIVGYMAIGKIEESELFSKLIQNQTDVQSVKDDLIDQDFNLELLEGLLMLSN